MTSLWERVKVGSKHGFDKTWQALDKVGSPVNRLSNKLGSEAFWPTTLDKECDKAARILKSFCRDGFYAEDDLQSPDGPKQKQRVLKKIPTEVVKNAKGLAIFTTMRTGLWLSGAGGSGILIARKPDGSWSPPSGILLHTAGLGFMVGVDIYDCVVVINSEQALEAFYKVRCTLGSEISIAAGPIGAGGILDSELHKRQAPIFTYMKSRGFYAGVQVDGTVIIERGDENERFYGQRIAVKDILGGQVRHPPFEVRRLLETIKAAQGDNNFDETVLPSEPPPSDFDIDDGRVFGVPDKEDPDPYGVLALEKEGMRVVEAGTQEPASWAQFTFDPSPTSPVHSIFNRNSVDFRRSIGQRSSWRGSQGSIGPVSPSRPSSIQRAADPIRKSVMVSSSTQTDMESNPASPVLAGMVPDVLRRGSKVSAPIGSSEEMPRVPENSVLESKDIKAVDIGTETASLTLSPSRRQESPSHPVMLDAIKQTGYTTPPSTPPIEDVAEESDDDDDVVEVLQPIVHNVQTVQPKITPVVSKARIVTVAKRIPPRLPARNPTRTQQDESPLTAEADSVDDLVVPDLERLEANSAVPTITASERPLSPPRSSTDTPPESETPFSKHPTHHEGAAAVQAPSLHAEAKVINSDDALHSSQAHDVAGSNRLSTLSNQSNGSSSTWDKVRALRALDDEDEDD